MKHLSAATILIVSLLQYATAYAQPLHGLQPGQATLQSRTQAMNHTGSPGPLAKGTATASRLIGLYAGYGRATGVIRNSDSTHYAYSGTRGGDLENRILSDNTVNYKWDTTANTWKIYSQYVSTYDAGNHLLQQVFQNWNGSAWVNSNRYTFTYDAAGLDTAETDEFWTTANVWTPSSRTRHTYTASGLPATNAYTSWSTATNSYSVPTQRDTYTYDAPGNLLSLLSETYNTTTSSYVNFYRQLYTYNAANAMTMESYESWNTTTSTWSKQFRFFFYYNSSNQEIAELGQTGSTSAGANWANLDSVTNVVDGGGNPVTQNWYHYSSGSWAYTQRHTSTFFGPGKLSTQLIENAIGGRTSYQNSARYFYFYNTYGQLTRVYGQKWNGTAWAIDATTQENRYYYEDYNNGVGVARHAPITSANLLLYPIPAHTSVEIAISFAQPATVDGVVTDASGKLLQQWTSNASTGLYTHTIQTASLPTGTYYITVHTGNTNVTKTFTVQH